MAHLKLNHWVLAARPKTLWAAISPVIVGTAMAYEDGQYHGLAALMALLGAVFIQIGTNLANDYFDFKKGADKNGRLGPTRVTQAGLVSPRTMRTAVIIVFLISFLFGLYLVWRGGWPVVIIGILSVLFAVLYTGGPYPLGYHGLGDIFVLIFFGPVAVGGTYYVQTLEINATILTAGLAPGLFSLAILTVNNLRDVESDKKAGKKTLAVRWGITFARREYLFSLITAALIPVILFVITRHHPLSLLSVLVLPVAIPVIKTVFRESSSPKLNDTLALTGQLLLLYSIIFSIGWLL